MREFFEVLNEYHKTASATAIFILYALLIIFEKDGTDDI